MLLLLQRQPAVRLQRIAQQWGLRAATPQSLYQAITAEPGRATELVEKLFRAARNRDLIIDMVQDYNLPFTLHPEDRATRQLLANWGLIYPYPQDWPDAPEGRASQWAWVMPLEVAVLAAPAVPIYRLSLPLLLGLQPPERLALLAQNLGLAAPAQGSALELALALSERICDMDALIELLEDPDWFDHLFTLQIVLEWHGACLPNELFSFAWGDETLVPFAARDQQKMEREIHKDLRDLGLLFEYWPPRAEGAKEEEDEDEPLLVMPEELRPRVWLITRGFQERTLANWLQQHEGWDASRGALPHQLAQEPLDQLKALACVLEGQPLRLDAEGALEADARAHLQELSQEGADWGALVELARLTEVLSDSGELQLGVAAAKLLDADPPTWSQALLRHWVEGRGPRALDRAQNLALGLSGRWLRELRPHLARLRQQPPLEPWWSHLSSPPPSPPKLSMRGARRVVRPSPTWLGEPGLEDDDADICCGYPRPADSPDQLPQELHAVEGVVVTFRLLLLDLLGGLRPGLKVRVESLAALVQDAASLAVHLNLAALFFDSSGQMMIPVRPPSYLAESVSDELFDDLAVKLLEGLLVPAGLASWVNGEREEFVLWSDRILVTTPAWSSERGRLDALAGVLEIQPAEVTRRRPGPWLRSVSAEQAESERRFWLGRPLQDLRRAINGRAITGLRGSWLEVTQDKKPESTR